MKLSHNPILNWLILTGLAFCVGIIGSIAAIVFLGVIAFFHNLFFLHSVNLFYQETWHTPSSMLGILTMDYDRFAKEIALTSLRT